MTDVYAILDEAEAFIGDRRWDQAIKALQSALQEDPTLEEACERLAFCYARRGLVQPLVAIYFKLIDILETKGELNLAVEVATWVLNLRPDNDQARLRIIRDHRRKGNPELAMRELLNLARVYIELGQGDKSIVMLQEILENDPDNIEVGTELAEIFIAHGQIPEGAAQLGKIAHLHMEQNNLEKAADCFRRQKLFAGDDPKLSLTIGNLNVRLQRFKEAEMEFRSILKHNLSNVAALMSLGNVCQKTGQFRDAALAYNKALSVDPENLLARERLGEVHQAQGNVEQAIPHFLEAAGHHQANGDDKRASWMYQRVVAMDPHNDMARQQLKAMGWELADPDTPPTDGEAAQPSPDSLQADVPS